MRYIFGFFSAHLVEIGFLGFALGTYCGPLYLANMALTLGAYSKFTRSVSKRRLDIVRDKKDMEKKQEFFQNESITNYESVKAFNGEKLEERRYMRLLQML